MTSRDINRPQKPNLQSNRSTDNRPRGNQTESISRQIINTISDKNLHEYDIKILVKQAEEFGRYLKEQNLKTNQIRKFLDAINRIKAQINQSEFHEQSLRDHTDSFEDIKVDIVLLKPKLAYAAARQRAVKPLSDVMSVAIDKVYDLKDFERLVQMIESIIAYHKAAGGEN
jgi:CRISPR-associated protein Csm2